MKKRETFKKRRKPGNTWETLSENEREAIKMLANGNSVKETANATFMSDRRVISMFNSHNPTHGHILAEYKKKIAKESLDKNLSLIEYASKQAKEHYQAIRDIASEALEAARRGDDTACYKVALQAYESLLDRSLARQSRIDQNTTIEQKGISKQERDKKYEKTLEMVFNLEDKRNKQSG